MAAFLYAKIGPQRTQQVIGLLFPNSWQFIVAYLAILKLGHIALPLDTNYKSLELGAVIDQIKPLSIITSPDYQAAVANHHAEVYLFEDSLASKIATDFQKIRLPAKEQIASVVFTSGTTGQPKAAAYSHANHIWNVLVCSEVWNWDKDDTLLISLPLSHWYGLVMGLAGVLYHGNTLYLHRWFDEEQTMQALASGKITIFTHISTVYFRLLEVKDDYDISGVRLCISGGSALPPEIWEQFKKRFGQEILECYGSSESGRIASNLLNERIPGSPGRILPQVGVKFSEQGEVLVRSPGVFPGYFRNPAATQASYTKDGWWRTGDIGELQAGRIVLKGRAQERIRRFGYTISPRDIEWAVHKHPKVKDVYVMGQPKEGDPNDSLSFFITGNISEAEVSQFCKENLPYAWRPDSIILLGSIPRTRNGKPKISQLKTMVH